MEALLIQRAIRPDDPASGHVALPGGRVEPSDTDLRATALRELREEVGLHPSDLLGPPRHVATDRASRFRMNVGVFAAGIAPQARAPSVQSAGEVAQVFWIPRATLGRTEWVVRDTSRGNIEVPATVFGDHVLWGFTRRVLRHFFDGRPLDQPDEDDRAFAARTLPPSDPSSPSR